MLTAFDIDHRFEGCVFSALLLLRKISSSILGYLLVDTMLCLAFALQHCISNNTLAFDTQGQGMLIHPVQESLLWD